MGVLPYSRKYDLPAVNRAALLLKPTQAYADWANSCGEGPKLVLSEMEDDFSSVYLIPEVDFRPDAWLRKHYRTLFEHELWNWCTDPSTWPKGRSFRAFQEFFTVHFHSMVVDLGGEPIYSSRD
jgi:hypothetical protein